MISIKKMTTQDPSALRDAFVLWNKPLEQYQTYLTENQAGWRVTLIAWQGTELLGYGNLLWRSYYEPFVAEGIPEINDLNVVPARQAQGIGRQLITELEALAKNGRHARIGIGVGLGSGYERARALYPRLGYVADGRGIHKSIWGDEIYMVKPL